MLFQIFKNRSPYWIIFIGLFGLGVWFVRVFSSLHEVELSGTMPLYQLLCFLLFKNKIAIAISGYIVFTLTAFGLIRLNRHYFFLPLTYLHSILFVLLASPFVNNHLFPAYIATFMLLIAIYYMFRIYKSEYCLSHIFNAGFFIGLASLFYLNTVFFLLIIFFSIIILNPSGFRKYIVGIVGFFLPWLFTWSYYFLTNQLAELAQLIEQNFLITEQGQDVSIFKIVYLSFIFLMLCMVSIWQIVRKTEGTLIMRKYFNIFLIILIISIALLALQRYIHSLLYPVIMLPLACILARDLIRTQNRFVKNSFLFFIISICIAAIFAI